MVSGLLWLRFIGKGGGGGEPGMLWSPLNQINTWIVL